MSYLSKRKPERTQVEENEINDCKKKKKKYEDKIPTTTTYTIIITQMGTDGFPIPNFSNKNRIIVKKNTLCIVSMCECVFLFEERVNQRYIFISLPLLGSLSIAILLLISL